MKTRVLYTDARNEHALPKRREETGGQDGSSGRYQPACAVRGLSPSH